MTTTVTALALAFFFGRYHCAGLRERAAIVVYRSLCILGLPLVLILFLLLLLFLLSVRSLAFPFRFLDGVVLLLDLVDDKLPLYLV